MTAETTPAPAPAREKTGIPRNPGRHELGMKATLLFPDRDIVERFYVPLIYTACRTCYSELAPTRSSGAPSTARSTRPSSAS